MNRINKFGMAVRKLRLARGFPQEKLAELANLYVSTISFVERRLILPALDTICALADAVQVKVSDLAIEIQRRLKESDL